MNYKIRKVEEKDFERFNAFCFEMYSEQSTQFPLSFQSPPPVIYTKKGFLSEINSKLEISLIALKGDEIVGFIQADIKKEEETRCFKGYTYADIRNFYVAKKYYNEELEKKLYLSLEQLAKDKGLDKMAVMSYGELKDDNFYLKQSFSPFSINFVKYLNT